MLTSNLHYADDAVLFVTNESFLVLFICDFVGFVQQMVRSALVGLFEVGVLFTSTAI